MIARALALLLLMVAPLLGQESKERDRRVKVTVVEVSGPILVVNRGQEAGLQKGDTIVFPRAGRPPVLATVLRSHARDARVELEDPDVRVAVGLRGDALIPASRQLLVAEKGDHPDHPPWKTPVGIWEEGKPLLAPIASPKAEERDSEIYGRLYVRYQDTDNALSDRHYSRVRTGLDYKHTNPFGAGGMLRFKGDVQNRYEESTGSDTEDSTSRLQRFSYVQGIAKGDARRIEVGRLLPHLFPQFGLLDGAEYIIRASGDTQYGANLGFQPNYDLDLANTDNFSMALFGRWVNDTKETLAFRLGFQKTWHEGRADRDLVATGLNWKIDPRFTFRVSALGDYFGGSGTIESEGLKLTQAHSSLDWQFGGSSGASLYMSYLDWPELLKDELPDLLPASIRDQKVLRGGVSTSLQLTKHSRLFGRYDTWSDNLNSGTFADVRLDMRDLLYASSLSSLGLFDTQGSFSTGLGARIRHSHLMQDAQASLYYETTQYEQAGFQGVQSELQQQVLGVDVSSRLRTDLDMFAEAQQRFGDEQDAFTMSMRLTWRF